MRRPRRHPRIRHEPGNRIILYYVKRSKVIRQSPVSRGGQTGCAARFDCADASHVARLRPDRYLLGGRQGWNKADPSPRPSKSGHPRQRVAHAPHHDVDAIDHVRSLGGVAERAQQGGHAEPDGEQRVAMSGLFGECLGDVLVERLAVGYLDLADTLDPVQGHSEIGLRSPPRRLLPPNETVPIVQRPGPPTSVRTSSMLRAGRGAGAARGPPRGGGCGRGNSAGQRRQACARALGTAQAGMAGRHASLIDAGTSASPANIDRFLLSAGKKAGSSRSVRAIGSR